MSLSPSANILSSLISHTYSRATAKVTLILLLSSSLLNLLTLLVSFPSTAALRLSCVKIWGIFNGRGCLRLISREARRLSREHLALMTADTSEGSEQPYRHHRRAQPQRDQPSLLLVSQHFHFIFYPKCRGLEDYVLQHISDLPKRPFGPLVG